MTYTCTCGDIYTETIDKLAEHNYETVIIAPTCTNKGYTTFTADVTNVTENEITTGRGNLSFTSINLPRIALKLRKQFGDSITKEELLETFPKSMQLKIAPTSTIFKYLVFPILIKLLTEL